MPTAFVFSFFIFLSSAFALTTAAPACADVARFLPLSTCSPAVSYCTNLCIDGQSAITLTSTVSTTEIATVPVTVTFTTQSTTATATSVLTLVSTIGSTLTTTFTSTIFATDRPSTSTSTETVTVTTVSTSTVTTQLPGKRNALSTYAAADACTTRPPVCTTYLVTSVVPRTSSIAAVPEYEASVPAVSGWSVSPADSSTTCTKTGSKALLPSSSSSRDSATAMSTQSTPFQDKPETMKAESSACSKKTRHSARRSSSSDASPSASSTGKSVPAVSSCTSTASAGVSSGLPRVSTPRPFTAPVSNSVNTLGSLLSSLTTLRTPFQTSVCGCIGAALSCPKTTIVETSTATATTTISTTILETATGLVPASTTITSTIFLTSITSTSTLTVSITADATFTVTSTVTSTATSVTTTTVSPQATCISYNRCDQASQQSYKAMCDTAIAPRDSAYRLFSQQARANAEACQSLCASYDLCEAYDFTPATNSGCRIYMSTTPARKDAARLNAYVRTPAAGYVSGVYRGDCQM